MFPEFLKKSLVNLLFKFCFKIWFLREILLYLLFNSLAGEIDSRI